MTGKRIAVVGMWHLGPVTAACLASVGHDVTAIDEDPEIIAGLIQTKPPVAEPGLAETIAHECEAGRLRFSAFLKDAGRCEVVWIAYDTPVDESDVADVEVVHGRSMQVLEHVRDGTVFVISSQMPVGSVARMEREFAPHAAGRCVRFACAPENLRLGKAMDVLLHPDRVVLGVRDRAARSTLEAVYAPITERIEWMSVESAEMTKHAINAFLATSVCFINEIAALCERIGADAGEVERGLKTDRRIGQRAYLHAGGAISGGTLSRDLGFLQLLGRQTAAALPLIDGVRASNENHKAWLQRQISEALGDLRGRTFAILGLTYKPGTNTLRRSPSVEVARWLNEKGASVRAFDPQITQLPEDLQSTMSLGSSIADALHGAGALVVMTPWPEFRMLDPSLVPLIVFDAGRFLEKLLNGRPGLRYYSIGKAI
jgi:UDPglucose 6-dehydrogenase